MADNTKALARVALALGLACSAAITRAEVVDRVAAIVGSQVVTVSDVRAAQTFGVVPAGMATTTAADVLTALVDRELMLGEVERYAAPEAESALLERRMERIRGLFPNPNAYEQALSRTGTSEGRLRAFVAENLRIDAYLDQRFGAPAQPTADEVQHYYLDHPAEFTRGGQLAAFDDVRLQVQERLTAVRRRALTADWLDRLRRITHVEINAAAIAGMK